MTFRRYAAGGGQPILTDAEIADVIAGHPGSAVEAFASAALATPAYDHPRILIRDQASEYCGQTPAAFSAWVRTGKLPCSVPGTRRWDRRALDTALDWLSGIDAGQDGGNAPDACRSRRTS